MPAATFAELFRRFYGLLESLEVEYFAYGGVVVAVWGAPRETVDVDAVVCVKDDDVEDLFPALARAGFSFPEEAKRAFPIDGWLRTSFRSRHADISLGRTPFDESALTRRRRVKLFGTQIWVASAEDLVLYKLVAHRYKDLGDAETILVRMRGQLDLPYLRKWADEIARGTGKFEVPGKLEDLIQRTRP
ncbi:MAG: hypothetical protein HY721_31030 [Planctomycetes bacterium]|nr:hypothetical protein [Planctomycetota bacterium]